MLPPARVHNLVLCKTLQAAGINANNSKSPANINPKIALIHLHPANFPLTHNWS